MKPFVLQPDLFIQTPSPAHTRTLPGQSGQPEHRQIRDNYGSSEANSHERSDSQASQQSNGSGLNSKRWVIE